MRLLPSAEGKIAEVLLAFPYSIDGKDTEDLLTYFQGIIAGLPAYTNVHVLGKFGLQNEASRLEVTADEEEGHIISSRKVTELDAVYPVPEEADKYYRHWVQDPFVILSREGELALAEPFNFGDRGSRFIAEHFCTGTGHSIKPSTLYFEGGNILAGKDYALVGPDTIEYNRLRTCKELPAEEGRKKIRLQFRDLFGVKRVISPFLKNAHRLPASYHGGKSGFQPLYHLDLFMMPAGKSRSGAEEILIAKIDDFRQKKIASITPEIQELKDALDETAAFFENYHRTRTDFRFIVTRIPLLVNFDKGVPYYHTWNNCILESYGQTKNAYLPKYHSGDSDRRDSSSVEHTIRSLFEMKGFSVHWVDQEFDRYAKSYGSLHCMVKVIKRSQS